VSDVFFDETIPRADLKGDPALLSVGQLSWIKNHEMIVRALPCLLSNKPNTHLYLIGPDGGKLAYLKKLCENLQVDDHVTFLGHKDSHEVCSYMKAADLLLQASFAEGLSTVLLEAMTSKLPFITTITGGNRYLVELEVGETISFNAYVLLGHKIMNLVNNQELMKKMRSNCKKHAHNYTWSGVFPRILKIYCMLDSS
jgi:glycosyltransferase involved in cell wall biosynthesis